MYAAFGAVLALLARGKTGRGQYVDSALYECAFSFMEPHIPAYEKLGYVAMRTGSSLPDSTPNNLYATRDRQFIHITAMGDAVFKRLTACMGQPELFDDLRFRDSVERSRHNQEIDDIIARWTESHDLAELEQLLHAAGVPATRIFTMADIFRDPHYQAREMLVNASDGDLGTVAMAAPVPRMSETPGRIRHAGGRVGQDTRRVLSNIARLSAEELDKLEAAGVIFSDEGLPEQAAATAGGE